MESKVCVVTGANSGIGKEVARELLHQGAEVVMACRNMDKCAAARTELLDSLPQSVSGSAVCTCMPLDVSDYASVRGFAAALKSKLAKRGTPLGVLVNNAGVMGVPPTPDGTDGHLLPNHFGPYLLTRLLVPAMGTGSRIVNVASRAHKQGSLDTDGKSIQGKPWFWYTSYARSKLCNVLFTLELTKRLEAAQKGITAYSISPGIVVTNIFNNVPPSLRWVTRGAGWIGQTPKQGASTVLLAATSPELEGKSVLYMHGMKQAEPSATAQDQDLAARLWSASENITGITDNDDCF